MNELSAMEVQEISGGDGAACANSILFWSGVGGGLGAFGGILGYLAGTVAGGGLAATLSHTCAK